MLIKDMKNQEMYELVNWGIECGSGWKDLLDNMTDEIKKVFPKMKFTQIKEKFGTLRAYCAGAPEEAHDIIEKYEEISAVTCEACGKPGKLYGKNWYKVRCDDCKKKEQQSG